jgi:membrane protein implicated in regulation of membrane protease activity
MVVLKYLVWFGVALISTGLTIGIVSGSWGAAATAFIIAGVVAIGIWLLFLGRMGDPNRPGFWQRRSTQASTNAFVGTLAVFVMLDRK